MTLDSIRRRTRHAWTQRAKLTVQVLTNSAYGSTAIAVADPVLKGASFGIGQLLALGFGLVCLYGAMYLAPEGARDGSD